MPLNEVIRLSISEAAKLFGVNPQTIRRAIQSQELTYIVVQGRYKVSFESLVKWSQRRATIKNKMETRGIGQYVDQWKIKNKLYSPNPHLLDNQPKKIAATDTSSTTTPTSPEPLPKKNDAPQLPL